MSPDSDPVSLAADQSVMIAAFEGWNDAGSAASSALDHLARAWEAREYATLDPEEYHDFQVSRPSIQTLPGGERVVSWPGTVLSTANGPWVGDREVVVVRGIEPSMRWRTFCREILDYAEDLEVSTLITCGALLVDAPHTRPLPTFVTSEDAAARQAFDLERSDYEGPTGVLGVLGHEASLRGITVISVWVGVPHYVAHPPSPKATVSILSQLERFLGEPIDLGEMVDEVDAWQRGADELAEEDEEIAAHVQQLESLMDETSLPEASGDAIAAEFEKFLRRRDSGNGKA
ncbi:PAC2 family protein [Demequina lignilytica]|uniref:PAC2 family protein n=1 Tax=Demequina lignilytica TaxID=3051663 RepID=A0AAW7MAG3_9MICO|nr:MULTISPECIES: PAC2 family protein [unclassified Demequina]MDN4479045.1 PAC2 family protein [Demequina sp. SYSU T00039-1]MDN4484345.1 PAC2 family protein [Demequina sp. SYSU T0a273]MDN4489036.1 PAC2 family protein [Demequina sp. SYSU T00039]MDN4491253.1 PAC2 family protein [Demequina sp. SYSU T00068]